MPAPDGTVAATYAVDARHSGASTSRLSSDPTVRWRHQWPSGSSNTEVFGAVSSGDLVVAAVQMQFDFVNSVEVAAFDRATGATRWSARFTDDTRGRIAVAGGRVFVNTLAADGAGRVRALDLRTGAVLWTRTPPNGGYLNAEPTPAGTDLYVTSGTSTTGQIHAFDQRTGTVRWTRTYSDMPGLDGTSPTVAGDAVVIGPSAISRSLRRSDGSQLWQSTINPPPHPNHAIAADATRAYISGAGSDPDGDGRILDLANGDVVGQFRGHLDPVVTADTLYTGDLETIEARAIGTGALGWRYELGPSSSGPNHVVIGPHLFWLDLFDGMLTGLSTATGEPELEIGLGLPDSGVVGYMNAGNGLILIPYGSELVVVS